MRMICVTGAATTLRIFLLFQIITCAFALLKVCRTDEQGSSNNKPREKCSGDLAELHVAALVLARGGSKGIKLKNIARVGGVPLLRRSLDAIHQAEVFDSIWVSTDHNLIAEEAEKGGALVHRRSPESATDTATSIFAVQEFLRHHREVNILALIQCTSPFIKHQYLRAAYELIGDKTRCSFSATRSFKLRWQEVESGIVPINFDPSRRPRRQDWEGELVENGMFYFANVQLLVSGHFQDNSCGFVEIPTRDSLEVDDFFDLEVANTMHDVASGLATESSL